MDFEASRGFKTGEKVLMWVDRTKLEIWLDRFKQWRWNVPTRKQIQYEVTATYTV